MPKLASRRHPQSYYPQKVYVNLAWQVVARQNWLYWQRIQHPRIMGYVVRRLFAFQEVNAFAASSSVPKTRLGQPKVPGMLFLE